MILILETTIYSGVTVCSHNCENFEHCRWAFETFNNDAIMLYPEEPHTLKFPSDQCPIFLKRGRYGVEIKAISYTKYSDAQEQNKKENSNV